jgi:hypothetical protein
VYSLKPKLPAWVVRSVLELAVIVSGVLIALGVDSAMQDVEDRAIEQQYLVALRDDLSGIAQSSQRSSWDNASAVVSMLEGEMVELVDTVDFVLALGRLSVTRTPQPNRASYEDLLSTGNLRLIRNAELRTALIDFYEFRTHVEPIRREVARYGFFAVPEKIREFVDPIVWARLGQVAWPIFWRELDSDQRERFRTDLARAVDFDAMRESDEFRRMVGRQLEGEALMRRLYSASNTGVSVERLIGLIDAELAD